MPTDAYMNALTLSVMDLFWDYSSWVFVAMFQAGLGFG